MRQKGKSWSLASTLKADPTAEGDGAGSIKQQRFYACLWFYLRSHLAAILLPVAMGTYFNPIIVHCKKITQFNRTIRRRLLDSSRALWDRDLLLVDRCFSVGGYTRINHAPVHTQVKSEDDEVNRCAGNSTIMHKFRIAKILTERKALKKSRKRDSATQQHSKCKKNPVKNIEYGLPTLSFPAMLLLKQLELSSGIWLWF